MHRLFRRDNGLRTDFSGNTVSIVSPQPECAGLLYRRTGAPVNGKAFHVGKESGGNRHIHGITAVNFIIAVGSPQVQFTVSGDCHTVFADAV